MELVITTINGVITLFITSRGPVDMVNIPLCIGFYFIHPRWFSRRISSKPSTVCNLDIQEYEKIKRLELHAGTPS